MTDAFTCWASRCGAPGVGCRTTITSAPIASMFLAVSMNVSPLERLEALVEKSWVSAESRLAARLKLVRVRVEFSKKRLKTMRPCSAGTFLRLRVDISANDWAVSRMAMISAADRSSSPSRCFRVQLGSGLIGAGTDAVPEPELGLGGDAMVTAQASCQAVVKGGTQPRRGRFLPRDQADAAAPERDRCDRSADAAPRSRDGWAIHDVRDPPARPVESVPVGPGRKSRSAPRGRFVP